MRATPCESVSSKSGDQFDMVLIHEDKCASLIGIEGTVLIMINFGLASNYPSGYRVAQVCVIFVLPNHIRYQKPLAYIEYFLQFTSQWQGGDLYTVNRSFKGGKREVAIISLDSIRCSCHLIPVFGSKVNPLWNSTNILESCSSFFVNPYIDRDLFQMFIG